MNTIFTIFDVLDMFIEENEINLVKLFKWTNDTDDECIFTGTLTDCLEFLKSNNYLLIPYTCYGIQKYNSIEAPFLRIDFDICDK